MAKHTVKCSNAHIKNITKRNTNSSKTPFFHHQTGKDLLKIIIFRLVGFSETSVPFGLEYTINESNLSTGQYASIPLK